MNKNENIVYDTSALFSYSPGISMAKFGHNNSDMTLPMIKVILGFSRSRNEPCYIRSDPGSVLDIDTLKSSQNDVPPRTLFVMDRGFIDDDNFNTMDTGGIYFITPLKKNSRIIDYSLNMKDFFMFRKRAIRYSMKKTITIQGFQRVNLQTSPWKKQGRSQYSPMQARSHRRSLNCTSSGMVWRNHLIYSRISYRRTHHT